MTTHAATTGDTVADNLADRLDTVVDRLERDGVAVIPGVLSAAEAGHALDQLWAASAESERRGNPAHIEGLDPNASNVRVFNLIDLDPLFAALIAHPVADAVVTAVLGNNYIVSNFTANIARPGSASMVVHSDLAAVMPEPWFAPLTINIVWCLTDVRPENGATLYIPGSHHYRTADDVPSNPISHMIPFEADAGSIIAMEGRVWHTSGRNVTEAQDRALLFGYYTKPFIRPQWNHTAALSADVQARFDPVMRYRLGLDQSLNRPNEKIFGALPGR